MKLYFLALILSFSLFLDVSSEKTQNQIDPPDLIESNLFGSVRLPTQAEKEKFDFKRKVALPERLRSLVDERYQKSKRERQSGHSERQGTFSEDNIQVTFDPDYPINDQTKEVFYWCAEVLSVMMEIQLPVRVFVSWKPMGPSVIGSAGPTYLVVWDKRYRAVALYNQLAGKRATQGYDITATFNSQFNFYLGTDGKTPPNQIDLASVVLHEFCHGLGFTSAATVNQNGVATYSVSHYIMDEFFYLGQTGSGGLVYQSSNLNAAFTSNNVFYIQNIEDPVNTAKIYAPATWESGSSMAHLDENTYANTDNTLMTPAIASGEYIHYIGPLANMMFASTGWIMRECSLYETQNDCLSYCCSYCQAEGTCGDPGVGDTCVDAWTTDSNCTGGDGRGGNGGGSTCSEYYSCGDCTSDLSCSWCPSSSTCVDGSVIVTDCSDWQWGQCDLDGWLVFVFMLLVVLIVIGLVTFLFWSCCCCCCQSDYDPVQSY